MGSKTRRTFKQLSTAERDMVRALVEELYYRSGVNYNESDICRLLNVSRDSISALKANLTMGRMVRQQ